MVKDEIILLFSGGLDSTTLLYWAKQKFASTRVLIIDYDQKHRIETRMARRIAQLVAVPAHFLELPMKNLVSSALINQEQEIPASLGESKNELGVPLTYVPFRNGIFLSLATALAETLGARHIGTGFNRIDTPDYPDTTADFSQKMAAAINSGSSAAITGEHFTIHTPLIEKRKKEIIRYGLDLGADFSYSISCYRGQEAPCLSCPSCDIRQRAFRELGLEDPLITRLRRLSNI